MPQLNLNSIIAKEVIMAKVIWGSSLHKQREGKCLVLKYKRTKAAEKRSPKCSKNKRSAT